MIEIMNLRDVRLFTPFDFRVDRRSPLGNPFVMTSSLAADRDRDRVCDEYAQLFATMLAHPDAFLSEMHYLDKMRVAHKMYKRVRLFCWCAPLRCHAETIKDYLEKEYTHGRDRVRRDSTEKPLAQDGDNARKEGS